MKKLGWAVVIVALFFHGLLPSAYGSLWSEPQLFTPANDVNEQDWRVILSPDDLSFYVLTERDGNFANTQIYRATRPTNSSPWSTPAPVPELNSSAQDHIYWISQDQTEAWMARHGNPAPSAFGDIYRTVRASPTDPWGSPTIVSELSGPSFDRQFHLTEDGLYGILSSNRPGSVNGSIDFWETSRPDTSSAWATPTLLTTLNTPAEERGAFLSPDGLTLYFCRLEQGLFEATRDSLSDPFSNPLSLNLPVDSIDPSFSLDGNTLYFSRPNGSQFNYDIYYSTKIPEPSTMYLLGIGWLMVRRKR